MTERLLLKNFAVLRWWISLVFGGYAFLTSLYITIRIDLQLYVYWLTWYAIGLAVIAFLVGIVAFLGCLDKGLYDFTVICGCGVLCCVGYVITSIGYVTQAIYSPKIIALTHPHLLTRAVFEGVLYTYLSCVMYFFVMYAFKSSRISA